MATNDNGDDQYGVDWTLYPNFGGRSRSNSLVPEQRGYKMIFAIMATVTILLYIYSPLLLSIALWLRSATIWFAMAVSVLLVVWSVSLFRLAAISAKSIVLDQGGSVVETFVPLLSDQGESSPATSTRSIPLSRATEVVIICLASVAIFLASSLSPLLPPTSLRIFVLYALVIHVPMFYIFRHNICNRSYKLLLPYKNGIDAVAMSLLKPFSPQQVLENRREAEKLRKQLDYHLHGTSAILAQAHNLLLLINSIDLLYLLCDLIILKACARYVWTVTLLLSSLIL